MGRVSRQKQSKMADSQCRPVFVTTRALPEGNSWPDTVDICSAAEAAAGRGTIRGAQRIRGLWQIQPFSETTRRKLLLEGMMFRGTRVSLLDKNPFSAGGIEKETTKVWVSNIPLNAKSEEVERALVRLGCELRSKMTMELARTKDGKLTKWETGRRFVWVCRPDTPLATTLQVGIWQAAVYHKEQSTSSQQTTRCNKCLLAGHRAASCTNEVVCLACKKSGHKRGDPLCEGGAEEGAVLARAALAPPPPPPHAPTKVEGEENSGAAQQQKERKKVQTTLRLTPRERKGNKKRAASCSPASRNYDQKRNTPHRSRADEFLSLEGMETRNRHDSNEAAGDGYLSASDSPT